MKKLNLLKSVLVFVVMFAASTTFSYGFKSDNNLIYNSEEVNGQVVSETVYKMDGTTLMNYAKHNYKYDANNQKTEDESQKWNSTSNKWENDICMRYTYEGKTITTNYYKWQGNKKGYVLIPEMTVTMTK